MNHYAKITGPHKGNKKIFVEIWETEVIDEITYDTKIMEKSFWTISFAKNWVEKTLIKLTTKNQLKHFFIKDEDVIRKDMS
jgi:hypothetical protein